MHTNDFIEKRFIYLLGLSLLLHLGLLVLIYTLPKPADRQLPHEPYMVDLQELPAPPARKSAPDDDVRRLDELRRRVPREMAPRGIHGLDRPTPPSPASPANIPPTAPPRLRQPATTAPPGEIPVQDAPVRRGEGLFRAPAPTSSTPDLSRLQPSADRLAKLEETYRRKFREEVAEGEAHFLNTNDLQFGSFLRRFETAVYGVWRYPQEAVRLGIEGVTPVRIVFNRQGEIEGISVLESSGSRMLDDEVLRTLRKVGRIGGFPRGYDKETFTLIAFFHYGIVRGEARSLR